MNKVSTYLIHNNSVDRIKLRNKLKNILGTLNIELKEIYKQSDLPIERWNLLFKVEIIKINFYRVYFNLRHKKDLSLKFFKLLLFSFLKFNIFIFNIILQNKKKDLKTINHIRIESIITKKHIKAWERFLKTNKKYILVFEDDVICKKYSKKRLKELIHDLNSFNFKHIFVDLAGGYQYNDIVPNNKIKKIQEEFIFIEGVYTNTACSYLMNRNLIEKLHKEYSHYEINKFFPIDHLINKLGLKIKNSNLSLYFKNPIFTHGSFKGNIESWQV